MQDGVCGRCDQYLDKNENKCVDACKFGATIAKICNDNRCPSLFYISKTGRLKCVDACVSDYPYQNGNKCVRTCPSGTFLQTSGTVCDVGCESRVYQTVTADGSSHDVCLPNDSDCAYTATVDISINGKYTRCYDTCPGDTFIHGKECVNNCPISKPAYQEDRICTTCKEIDPDSAKLYWENGGCVEKCSDSSVLALGSMELCVSSCGAY